jgi:hypothetical protein
MRRYSKTDEESVRVHAAVREWTRSGFLEKRQGAVLAKEVQPALKRTNIFFRIVLFLFTSLIAGASVLLVLVPLGITDRDTTSAICIAAAMLCFGLAEFIIDQFGVYRFGVEEAFAVMAVVLAIGAAVQLESNSDYRTMWGLGLSVGAIASLVVYGGLGLLYAGIAAIAFAALTPFSLIHALVAQRIVSASMLLAVFLIARRQHVIHGYDFPGDDYAIFQTAAWAGLYIVANLKIVPSNITAGWFYWATYASIWILPVAGLWLGLRGKDRFLIDINAAMVLATLSTNKSYLGLKHQPWDPMLLGMLLMGTGIVLRRWLAAGPNGERRGFTPVRILSKDARLMAVVGTASAAFHTPVSSPQPAASQPGFDGGRSGGAGASGEF